MYMYMRIEVRATSFTVAAYFGQGTDSWLPKCFSQKFVSVPSMLAGVQFVKRMDLPRASGLCGVPASGDAAPGAMT